MKIFLVEQCEVSGYDNYDEFVIICDDEEEAKHTSPYGNIITEKTGDYDTWVGIDKIDKVKVTYLGEAKEGSIKGIVCSSFHAG